MKIVLFAFFGLLMAVSASDTVSEEWAKFKKEHNKLYGSEEEENKRFQIFEENFEKIRKHNELYEKGETTYLMGVNKFSDLTSEEFKAMFGRGVLPRKKDPNPKQA